MFAYENTNIICKGTIAKEKNLAKGSCNKTRERELYYLFNCSYLGPVLYNFRISEFISNVELLHWDSPKYNFEIFELFQI